MKTERRHELQTNVLADWLATSIETSKPYANWALGAILVAAVLFVVYAVMSGRTERESAKDWNRYFAAAASEDEEDLQQVVQDLAGTSAGAWANLLLADRMLNLGIENMFSDRAKANEQLRAAVEGYRAVSSDADPVLQERAKFGLGRAYETQKDVERARKEYEDVIRLWPQGPLAEAAQRRLDDLARPATLDFYAWFEQQEPTPPPKGGPGIPGLRPSDDLDLPDFNLPESMNDADLQLLPSGGLGEDASDEAPDGGSEPDDDGDEAADDAPANEESAEDVDARRS